MIKNGFGRMLRFALLGAILWLLPSCGDTAPEWTCSDDTPLTEEALRQMLKEDPSRIGGNYHNYEAGCLDDTPAPRGYKPFYISHYGRHGSRYHTPRMCENLTPSELDAAEASGLLTEKGKALKRELYAILDAQKGHQGELTEVGENQHRGISERMDRRFPQVFRNRDSIDIVSSIFPRCLISMASFEEPLLSRHPGLHIVRHSGKDALGLLAARYKGRDAYYKEIKQHFQTLRAERFDPSRLMASLFQGDSVRIAQAVPDPQHLARSIAILWAITQDYGDTLTMDIHDYLTEDEIFAQAELSSMGNFAEIGPSAEYADRCVPTAKALLRDMVRKADAACGNGRAADLRFGHDTGLAPLLALMGVRGMDVRTPFRESFSVWPSFLRMPMASNVQLVFYRHPRKEDILVKILRNEQETDLPALRPYYGPYYRWEDLKAHWDAIIDAPDPEVPYLGPNGEFTYIPG